MASTEDRDQTYISGTAGLRPTFSTDTTKPRRVPATKDLVRRLHSAYITRNQANIDIKAILAVLSSRRQDILNQIEELRGVLLDIDEGNRMVEE